MGRGREEGGKVLEVLRQMFDVLLMYFYISITAFTIIHFFIIFLPYFSLGHSLFTPILTLSLISISLLLSLLFFLCLSLSLFFMLLFSFLLNHVIPFFPSLPKDISSPILPLYTIISLPLFLLLQILPFCAFFHLSRSLIPSVFQSFYFSIYLLAFLLNLSVFYSYILIV